jgi:hypothetical protein
VPSPHSNPFHYRRHIAAIVLMGAIAAPFIEPGSGRADTWSDLLVISLASLVGCATMRVFTSLAVRLILDRWPRAVRAWGLGWFYGAPPLALFALYLGSWKLNAPTPSPATLGLVVATAVSIAAGAFQAVHANAGRVTTAPTAAAAPAAPARSGTGR